MKPTTSCSQDANQGTDQDPDQATDHDMGRPAAQDLTQDLAARRDVLAASLLKAASATAALAAWAARRGWAEPILAHKLETARRPAPADINALLQVNAGERLGFRRVELVCGARVLSRADNWFVCSRLPAAINRQLDAGAEPFGQLIGQLAPQRLVLGVEQLWMPAIAPVPDALFQIRAVVTGIGPQGRAPLAVVAETYLVAAIA